MIKFDSENPNQIKIAGAPKEIAVEVAAFAKTIHDMMLEYDEDVAMEYQMNLLMLIFAAFENNHEEKKRLIAEHEKRMELFERLKGLKTLVQRLEDSKSEDIRRSEFDSDDEFRKWFHGEEDEE